MLTNEQGLIGGAPASGMDAGAAVNYTAMIDQPYKFDFYDGGGLDLAFLSFAQVDARGNVNVSRFNGRIIGPGGFPNISQNARLVIFSGTLTAGSLQIAWEAGQTKILREGRHLKFIQELEHVTYNGSYAHERGQRVLYITERAVFQLGERGMELIEVASGVDLDRDILARMQFRPAIASQLRQMDLRLFLSERMGLATDLAKMPRRNLPRRLREPDANFPTEERI